MIYEGTNGIPGAGPDRAQDHDGSGAEAAQIPKIVHKFCQAQAEDAAMAEFIAPLQQLLKDITDLTMAIGMQAMTNRDEVGAAAVDYLRLLGHLVYGYFLGTHGQKVALANRPARRRRSTPPNSPRHASTTAGWMTETAMLQASIQSGAKT